MKLYLKLKNDTWSHLKILAFRDPRNTCAWKYLFFSCSKLYVLFTHEACWMWSVEGLCVSINLRIRLGQRKRQWRNKALLFVKVPVSTITTNYTFARYWELDRRKAMSFALWLHGLEAHDSRTSGTFCRPGLSPGERKLPASQPQTRLEEQRKVQRNS